MKPAYFLHKSAPYDHQVDAVCKLYPLTFGAEFMEQGTGKTKVAIDLATNWYKEGLIDAVMVIAPNGVHDQWKDEELPKHHSEEVPRIALAGSASLGRSHSKSGIKELHDLIYKPADGLKWFMINVDAFSTDTHVPMFREYVRRNKTLVIVDEATRIKNPDAKRSTNIKYGLCDLTKAGKRILKAAPLSTKRLVLTGTMVTNSPYDLWNMFEFLSPGFWGIDFFTFKLRYGIERRMEVPGRRGTYYRKITSKEMDQVRKYARLGKECDEIARMFALSESSVRFIIDNPHIRAPYKNLDELKRKIEPYAFIVRKQDCLDLPPKIYEKLYVEMNDEQKRVYSSMLREMSAEYNDMELTALNKVSLILRLQQITGGFFPSGQNEEEPTTPIGKKNPKIEALKADLDECSDFPIIIAARFRAEIEAITAELTAHYEGEKTVRCIYGSTPMDERREIRDAFLRNEVDVLVASARIIGTGFNLQNSHMMYRYSNSYSFEDYAQLEDRIHRNGQTSDTVVYKDLIVRKTVDEQVYEVLQNKKDLLEFMRDKTLHEFIGRMKGDE